MTLIPQTRHLIPYVSIAEAAAKKSPCLRRQYGVVIVDAGPTFSFVSDWNDRVGKCCKGGICDRTMIGLTNGERTEVGAEIHAETAALIRHGPKKLDASYFILVGFANGNPIYGRESYPCHSCAMAIKYAGYLYVYLLDSEKNIRPYSINQILIDREQEWMPAE